MGIVKNIAGNQYGRLTVLYLARTNKNAYWLCECTCGTLKEISSSNLKSGKTNSCGCLQKEITSSMSKSVNTVHGHAVRGSMSKIYRVWADMKQRCSNPKYKNFNYYGGRGISVCNEWLNFEAFENWALLTGYESNLELDRRDNDKGYSEENCRWVTKTINMRNRRAVKNTSSQYVGVSFNKKNRKWVAQIGLPNKQTYIGSFTTENSAADARNKYIQLHELEGFTLNILK